MEENKKQKTEEELKNMTLLHDDDLDPVSGGTQEQLNQLCFLFNCGEDEALKKLYEEFGISSMTSSAYWFDNIYTDRNRNRMSHKDVLLTVAREKCPDLVPYIEQNIK